MQSAACSRLRGSAKRFLANGWLKLEIMDEGYIVGVETDQATLHVSSSAKKPPFMFGKWLLNEQKKQRSQGAKDVGKIMIRIEPKGGHPVWTRQVVTMDPHYVRVTVTPKLQQSELSVSMANYTVWFQRPESVLTHDHEGTPAKGTPVEGGATVKQSKAAFEWKKAAPAKMGETRRRGGKATAIKVKGDSSGVGGGVSGTAPSGLKALYGGVLATKTKSGAVAKAKSAKGGAAGSSSSNSSFSRAGEDYVPAVLSKRKPLVFNVKPGKAKHLKQPGAEGFSVQYCQQL